MRVDAGSGLADGARFVPSPNRNPRPPQTSVEALIVHCISLPPGEFGGDAVEKFFCNRLDAGGHPYYRAIAGMKVSAHFFLRRDGDVVQFVPVHECAWHAGESMCLGRSRVNDFSVGVELEGVAGGDFTDAQYGALAALSGALMRVFPGIRPRHIFAHSEIAPQRKSDPGDGFDWPRYRKMLARFAA